MSNFDWQRLLPHRLSSQLLFFVGFTTTLAIVIGCAIFTFESVKNERSKIDAQIQFLNKNIAAMSGMLIINKDILFLDEVLLLNAKNPLVSDILIVDDQNKVLSAVVKKNGQITPQNNIQVIAPHHVGQVFDVNKSSLASASTLETLFPDDALLELWHPIVAGKLLGSVRIRYSLSDLHHNTKRQWQRISIFATLTVLGAFGLLALLIHAPMRALSEMTLFASNLNRAIGSQTAVRSGTKEFLELTGALNGLSLQLQVQERNLAEQMERNQSILDNVVDAIFTLNSTGVVQSFNLAACTIFGYSADEVIGGNITQLIPDFKPNQYANSTDQNNETAGQRKDGSAFPIDLAISSGIEHNEIIYIGVARDISERRRLDRLKSEFVSTVSHELRTPLTSIHGSLKLLEGGAAGSIAPPALKLVGLAQKNSQRLILLINDLLDMEKLSAGKMTLAIAPTDLVSIVKQSILDNGGYGLTLDVQYVLAQSPDQLTVLADAGRLTQVLANLLSNAAKFSAQSHQVDIRVIAEPHADAPFARVEVEDHGEGIPEDFQHEIFGAFAQANNGNTRKQGGTGLGLKISKSLINAMHGEIGFTTRQGSGTTFWFSVPLVNPATQDIESTST